MAKVLKLVAAVVVVAALVVAVAQQWQDVKHELGRLGVLTILGAAAALLVGLGCSVLAWRALLTGLGSELHVPTAARIFFVGQLGKYVPGSVWPVLAQMEMGRAVGVPRARMAAGSLMAVLLSLATGLLVGLLAVNQLPDSYASSWLLAILAVVPLLLVLARPQLITTGLQLVLKLLRRQPLEGEFTGSAVRVAVLWTVGAALANGVHAWLLARGLGAHGADLLPLAIGAFSLAQTGGVLFLIAPAGAGVREGLLVVLFASALPTSGATALAVVSRLLVTGSDALAAGAALLGNKAFPHPTTAGHDTAPEPVRDTDASSRTVPEGP